MGGEWWFERKEGKAGGASSGKRSRPQRTAWLHARALSISREMIINCRDRHPAFWSKTHLSPYAESTRRHSPLSYFFPFA